MGQCVIPCNWLQIMENSCDPCHTEWLHGNFAEFVFEQAGRPQKVPASRKHVKIGFDEFEWGIIKRRMLVGQTEADEDWATGHPLVFPNTLGIGTAAPDFRTYQFQIRVPIDDENTRHYWYNAFVPPPGVTVPQHLLEQFDVYDVPFQDEHGEFLFEMTYAQDIMAWITQGTIADRTKEAIGTTDKGVLFYRKMLFRELERVQQGHDPKGVIRDPARNTIIELPLEHTINARKTGFEIAVRRHNTRYTKILEELIALYNQVPEPLKV
jgi:5,5'-dehydrodivanillate O-demethylase